jgi:hypothetical protein
VLGFISEDGFVLVPQGSAQILGDRGELFFVALHERRGLAFRAGLWGESSLDGLDLALIDVAALNQRLLQRLSRRFTHDLVTFVERFEVDDARAKQIPGRGEATAGLFLALLR